MASDSPGKLIHPDSKRIQNHYLIIPLFDIRKRTTIFVKNPIWNMHRADNLHISW
jgi:hypothetical protein